MYSWNALYGTAGGILAHHYADVSAQLGDLMHAMTMACERLTFLVPIIRYAMFWSIPTSFAVASLPELLSATTRKGSRCCVAGRCCRCSTTCPCRFNIAHPEALMMLKCTCRSQRLNPQADSKSNIYMQMLWRLTKVQPHLACSNQLHTAQRSSMHHACLCDLATTYLRPLRLLLLEAAAEAAAATVWRPALRLGLVRVLVGWRAL